MKKLLIVSFFIFIISSTTALAYPNDPTGFRAFSWGETLDQYKDQLTLDHTEDINGGVDFYSRTNDEMVIGAAKLSKVLYGFWQGKLAMVTISTPNPDELLSVFTVKFGTGIQANEFIPSYFWDGTNAIIFFKKDEIDNTAFVMMVSKNVKNQMDTWSRNQSKEGANKGF